MIRSFKSKALRVFWTRNDPSGLRADWRARIGRQLDALHAAIEPAELDRVGWKFHALTGDKRGRFALAVSRNWRLTFAWEAGDASEIDLVDDHGG